ncbi:hypothetical protein GCK32_005260 [Trichostrongylus colubriformis]|uniref:Uncharacterized protein n=1 Tax=Trichostrongylus colubriformis TaxID=6319 RepID=A0AAN8FHH5_TRICO
MARVDKDLRRTKHEIFPLDHRMEELRREDPKANESIIYAMRKEKYELEMALTKKKDDLEMALYEWTRKQGRKDTTKQPSSSRIFISPSSHRYQRSTSPRHGSQKGSPKRSHHHTPSHRGSTRRSCSPGCGHRGV